jgi:predicted dienelactone hydrolase
MAEVVMSPKVALVVAAGLVLAGCSGIAQATAEPPIVGVRTLSIADSDGATFDARVWYQTTEGVPQTIAATAVRTGYEAVPDGPLAQDAAAPLVILVHGTAGSADTLAWVAVDLVARGAIVVAANHPASAGGDPNRRSILDVWSQPEDVRRMISQLLASDWSAHIDPDRIAVIGFSLGGGSAMMLAGARLSMEELPAFCASHEDGACSAFRPHFPSLDAAYFARANADYADPRLKAVIAIAPSFTESMTPASLRDLHTPVLIVASEHDQQLPPKTHMPRVRENIRAPSAYLEIAGAHHFSFMPLCTPRALAILAETGEEFVCQEIEGRAREQIHAEALTAIDDFLTERGVLSAGN